MGDHTHKALDTPEALRSRRLVVQSMVIAAGLAALKISAGLAANSMSLLASALDSVMDLFSSSVNYVSLVFSQAPPDEEHPYGHGKIEAIAGSVQGVVIGISGLALLVESIRRAVSEETVSVGVFAIGVMAVSMIVSVIHARRLRRQAEETESPILRAEGLHYSIDVLANFGVIVALAAVRFGASPVWDVVISMFIAAYVVKEAAALLNGSVHQLLDHKLSDEEHSEIRRMIRSHHPSIIGHHDFRTRRSGSRIFVDCHIEIAGVDKFKEAHDITESLVEKIQKRFPNADVTIHYDPEGAR